MRRAFNVAIKGIQGFLLMATLVTHLAVIYLIAPQFLRTDQDFARHKKEDLSFLLAFSVLSVLWRLKDWKKHFIIPTPALLIAVMGTALLAVDLRVFVQQAIAGKLENQDYRIMMYLGIYSMGLFTLIGTQPRADQNLAYPDADRYVGEGESGPAAPVDIVGVDMDMSLARRMPHVPSVLEDIDPVVEMSRYPNFINI